MTRNNVDGIALRYGTVPKFKVQGRQSPTKVSEPSMNLTKERFINDEGSLGGHVVVGTVSHPKPTFSQAERLSRFVRQPRLFKFERNSCSLRSHPQLLGWVLEMQESVHWQ